MESVLLEIRCLRPRNNMDQDVAILFAQGCEMPC